MSAAAPDSFVRRRVQALQHAFLHAPTRRLVIIWAVTCCAILAAGVALKLDSVAVAIVGGLSVPLFLAGWEAREQRSHRDALADNDPTTEERSR